MNNILKLFSFIIIVLLFPANCFADNSKDFYIDGSLGFDYGLKMGSSSSSINYTHSYPSSGNGLILQISTGMLYPIEYNFLNQNFGKIGILLDYQYLFDKKGDLQSLKCGVELKLLWILKAQAGIGKAWSEKSYSDGLNSSSYNKLCMFLSVGPEVYLGQNFSLFCYYRSEMYDSNWPFTMGTTVLDRNSLSLGINYLMN